MSTPRLYQLLPTLVAALIACAAAGLFLHTAAARHERAEKLRLAARMTHDDSAADPARPSPRPGPSAGTRGPQRKTIPQQMQAIQETGDVLVQTRALLATMRDFSSDDFRVALGSADSLSPGDRPWASSKLLEEWLRRDPDAAMMYAETRPSELLNVIRMWSNADARALATWLQKQAEGKRKTDLLVMAVPCIMKKEPDLAMSLMTGLTADVRQDILRRLPQEQGPLEAAVRWVDSLPDSPERNDAILALCSSPSRQLAPVQFALLARYPGLFPEIDLAAFFKGWPSSDGAGSAAAFEQVPEGELRRAAVKGAVPMLLGSMQPELGLKLMDRYPDEIDDSVLVPALRGVRSPPSALGVIDRIQDPYLRDQTYAETLDRWIDGWGDGEAQKWMSEHEISASVRQKMKPNPARRPPGS